MLPLLLACTGAVPDTAVLPETGDTGTVPTPPPPPPAAPPPNLLVIIADDVGITSLDGFGRPGDAFPVTPAIDSLVARGVRFPNAYANPVCTPTRFTALTGRYVRRRGVGRPIFRNEDFETSLDEVSLAQVLEARGYTSLALGKWHLSSDESETNYAHPLLFGFEHHGFIQRLDYWDWLRNDVGELSIDPRYQATALADDTIHYANTTPGPWLIWAGFLSAHDPIHVPPAELNVRGVTNASPELEKYFAMIEAMDLEIGRMLTSIDPDVLDDTIIVFLGDNGTIAEFVPTDWVPQRGKGSTYEGGVNVPLVVAGPGIAEGVDSEVLVHTADLFPTLIELAGIDLDAFSVTTVGHWDEVADGAEAPWLDGWDRPGEPIVVDGASFAPSLVDPEAPGRRRYIYTERFWPKGPPPYPNDIVALRDERFKLMDDRGVTLFFDLEGRADDGPDLLTEPLSAEASEAYDRLTAVMSAHSTTLVYEP
ncbi:MAG: sulfatase-like hydrolase/transferase [Myxococcota bacterium]